VSVGHAVDAVLVRALMSGARRSRWERSLRLGAVLGDLVAALGIRRRVAEANLAGVVPAWGAAERRRILREHYRELGRVVMEYARLAELARAPRGAVVEEARGLEHLERARREGRGAILITGHYGNFELAGAFLAQMHPVDFVVRPLTNPRVEAMITREREAAGVGIISAAAGVRRVYESLKRNRWVTFVADQDARGHGLFVPFLGRPASTPAGPARIALATGAPLITGFIRRVAGGRHELDVDPALELPDVRDPGAVARLTAAHVARLERRVREHPEQWFWLHRRWKTHPPAATGEVSQAGG